MAPIEEFRKVHFQCHTEPFDSMKRRVVVASGIGDLLDRVGAQAGLACQIRVAHVVATALLIQLHALTQADPQTGRFFWLLAGYCGYPASD